MVPESINVASTNDPLTLKNLGNREGLMVITAYDLFGITTQTDQITASSFAVSVALGGECTGTTLVNATEITIPGSSLAKGPAAARAVNVALFLIKALRDFCFSFEPVLIDLLVFFICFKLSL